MKAFTRQIGENTYCDGGFQVGVGTEGAGGIKIGKRPYRFL